MADRSSKRCALRRMARARCPRPQGPSAGCRARRPLVPCRSDAPLEGRHSAFPGALARPTRCDRKEVRLSAHREGRMPSLQGAPACSCNGEGPPGGEGILPSHAPSGAHGQSIFEAMRLAAHGEGKMPSPPGARPLAVGLADPWCQCQLKTAHFRREGILPSLARASAPNSLRPEGSAPAGAQGRQNAFPPPGASALLQWRGALGGEGILPSHAPPGAHGQSIFEAMRLAAHSEGKMPSPPGVRPMAVGLVDPWCLVESGAPLEGRHSAFPSARKRAQLVATGRKCAYRRTGKAECLSSKGRQRAPAMARGPLGARASCPRTRRQARMASRSSKRCALRRMARARCPRPQGPVR